ncbi:MAG: TIR domain-containing protein [Phycisphaerae bacterium]
MSKSFDYDIFLSYASPDRATVRQLAERLRSDGLRVWFDEWEIRPGDNIPLQISRGVEHARVLVLFMTPAFFVSEWTKFESYSLIFRDPSNRDRRFIPVLATDCELPVTLGQFRYIDWRGRADQAYRTLLAACGLSISTGQRPRAICGTARAAPACPGEDGTMLSRRKVLIVEDAVLQSLYLEELLIENGFDVAIVNTPQEWRDHKAELDAAVIILDMMFSVPREQACETRGGCLAGIELYRDMLAYHQTANKPMPPTIVLTAIGAARAEIYDQARKYFANLPETQKVAWIDKPVNVNTLLAQLNTLAGRP